MVYDLSLRGVEVSAQLKLEAYEEPLRQVTLLMDPQLQLVTALRGDAAAPWSVVSPPGSPLTRVVVTLPEPIRDGTGVLRLRALAPLVTGEPWRLPRIYPEGMFWQEGRRHAPGSGAAAGRSGLDRRSVAGNRGPVRCRRAEAGESAQFEYFCPRRHRGAGAGPAPRSPCRSRSATATELGRRQDDRPRGRRLPHRPTPRSSRWRRGWPPRWTVDSIESSPADALDDWSFDKAGRPAALSVRLAKALVASRPVRLVVVARRLYAGPGANLGIDDLLPLQFPAATEERQLVAVRADGACTR